MPLVSRYVCVCVRVRVCDNSSSVCDSVYDIDSMTSVQVSKPEGPDWRQRAVFSGDKWMHCHGAQAIFGPDGMFYDWFDEPVGRRNDKYFMRDSNVNAIMRDCQLYNEIQYWIYLDKGYDWNSHCRVAARGALTAHQFFNNWVMSKVREGIEWGFGKLKSRNPLVLRSQLLKLQMVDVAKIIRVAVLLTNLDTCLHGSNTSLFFNCFPPTLQQYLA